MPPEVSYLARDHAAKIDEMIRVCADHSWNNENGNYRHRRQFQEIGINSAEQLRQVLEQAIKSEQTRSFNRKPNPVRGQTEDTLIFQATLRIKENERQLTVILNPDRDAQGRLYGGTAYLNDPKRRTDISRLYQDELDSGNHPKLLMRGADLSLSEEQALKSPISRLSRNRTNPSEPTGQTPPPKVDPKYAREVVNTPAPEQRQEHRPDLGVAA